jgi:hypothetical protein
VAKRKKKEEVPPCLHCSKVFQFVVKFCPKCEDHFELGSWAKGGDICDRCASGANDEYLERRKGSPARVAQALEDMKDPTNWSDLCGGAVERYKAWVASPEFAKRFEERIPSVLPPIVQCANCEHINAYHDSERPCRAFTDKTKDMLCDCKGWVPR